MSFQLHFVNNVLDQAGEEAKGRQMHCVYKRVFLLYKSVYIYKHYVKVPSTVD